MQIIFDSKEKSIVRLDKDEEVLESLKLLAAKRDASCTFSMIGAAAMADLGYYNLGEKRYFSRTFESGHIEILSCSGSVAWDGEEILVHAHGAFSNERNTCFGGHVMKLVISVTAEIVIDWLPQKIIKTYNEEIGLKILSV